MFTNEKNNQKEIVLDYPEKKLTRKSLMVRCLFFYLYIIDPCLNRTQ